MGILSVSDQCLRIRTEKSCGDTRASSCGPTEVTTGFAPDLVTTMRWALDAASDRVPVTSRTPATKAKMAQHIVRSAHEGITDAHQLVAAAVAEGMVPAL